MSSNTSPLDAAAAALRDNCSALKSEVVALAQDIDEGRISISMGSGCMDTARMLPMDLLAYVKADSGLQAVVATGDLAANEKALISAIRKLLDQ